MEKEKIKCCICGKEIDGFGNNPYGAMWIDEGKICEPMFDEKDRCCDECNALYVITGRLYKLTKGGDR